MFWLREIVARRAGEMPSYTEMGALIKLLVSSCIGCYVIRAKRKWCWWAIDNKKKKLIKVER